jgi:hypothetical protein
MVTDALTGDALDLGTSTYRPSAALAEFVRARDQFCVFPGVRHEALLTSSEVRDRRRCYVAS